MLDQIRRSYIRNYSIFYKEGMLFSYLEYIGFDYENDMEDRGEAKPGNTGMWKACIPCQIPVETRKEGEWWASIKEVFYLR